MCLSSSGSVHVNICKIIYHFFSTVFVSSVSKLPLFFPPSLPFVFLQGLRFLLQVSILLMGSFSILFRQYSYPVILMKILMELQVRHSSFFSSPVDLIQALVLSILLFFQCFSYAGAPLNHPSLAIKLFRSAQDISKIRVSTLHSFKIFRGCSLIQVFYFNRCIISLQIVQRCFF